MSHVRIVLTGHGRGEVFVDGEQVHRVRRIAFKFDAGDKRNEVVLTINPQTVEIEGPADVVTTGVRLSQLLQQIADDPGTRLAPDLACSVLEFSTRVRK